MTSATPFSPAVLTYTDALRALRLAEAGEVTSLTIAELTQRTGRVLSNVKRDLPKLIEAGVIRSAGDDRVQLTSRGDQWLDGMDRAEGLTDEGSPASDRWPADLIRRNPLNRVIPRESVRDLADTIVTAGDVIVPLDLTPPDAHGVRELKDGERRWIAVDLLAEEGKLPPALANGIRFVEHQDVATDLPPDAAAEAADSLLTMLITASQREDLPPYEDARMLWALHEATGWSATEITRRIGRLRADAQGRPRGQRDVQAKLQIMRDASADAIAAYEADPSAPGAWDTLRESVRVAKEQAAIVTTKAQRLALAELLHKAGGQPLVNVAILPAAFQAEGERLMQYELANLTRSEKGDVARVTRPGLEYLQAEGLSGSIENARAKLGYPEGYGVARYRTEWLNTLAAPAKSQTAAEALAAHQALPQEEQRRIWADERRVRITEGCEAANAKTILVLLEVADKAVRHPHRERRDQTVIGPHMPDKTGAVTAMVNHLGAGFGSGGGEPDYVSLSDVSIDWLRAKGWLTEEGATANALHAARKAAIGIEKADAMIGQAAYWTPWLNVVAKPAAGAAQPTADEDPLVVNGVSHSNLSRANEARRAAGILPRQSNSGGGTPTDRARTTVDEAMRTASAPRHPLADTEPQAYPTNEALRLIAIERARQVEAENWTPDHDDESNAEGEMAAAAAAYALGAIGARKDALDMWPADWDEEWFKSDGSVRDLVKAGALIVAEIERRQRAELSA